MAEIIISPKQLRVINRKIEEEKNYNLAKENWENFSSHEKKFVLEFLKVAYPEKSNLIKESWYNTLGDIVGIFDPTGVVDLVNGISYISKGEHLFGFLSLISAVPYIGDAVAKPVMGALRVGAPSAKALEEVLKLSKAGESVKAAEHLTHLSTRGGLIGRFVEGFGKIGSKLRGFVERLPLPGPLRGLKNTILQWIELFEKGAKTGKTVRAAGEQLAKNLPKLSKADQIAKLTQLKNLAKDANFFRSYRTSKGLLSWKTIFGGMPQLIGRNKSVRALARQTKWWAGFLDFVGIGNFVGPDEVLEKMGQEGLENKLTDYQKTQEGQQNFKDSFGEETNEAQTAQQSQTTQQQTSTQSGGDKLGDFFSSILGSQLKKAALMAA